MINESNDTPQHGRKAKQKVKPYLVMQHLLKEAGEKCIVAAISK